MNLQRFAAALPSVVSGTKVIYLYRLLKEKATQAATYVAYSTEGETSISRDADSTATKDGPIRTPGEIEIEVSVTSLLTKGDVMLNKLRKALIDGDVVELWEVNLEEPHESNGNQFKGAYYQANVTEFTQSSNADGSVEVQLTFGVSGKGASGYATVDVATQEQATYVFADTTKTGA